jgi:RNA-directed DNA polymerase
LLAKLDTVPALRRTVKGWRRAGVLHEGACSPTNSGVPQGGTSAPVLMNVALHGREQGVAAASGRGTRRPPLIRYAEDLVVFHPDLAGVQAARAALEHGLAERGLALKPSKTRSTHTLERHEGQVGCDVLGCTGRQFRVGKTHSGRGRHGRLVGCKTISTPRKVASHRHVPTLGDLIRKQRALTQDDRIGLRNPRIQGWATDYRSVVAATAVAAWDSHLYHQLRSWCLRRPPPKARHWMVAKYWRPRATRRWTFTSPAGVTRRRPTQTASRRSVKVRKEASVFDGKLVYWAPRVQRQPETGVPLGRLLRAHGSCAHTEGVAPPVDCSSCWKTAWRSTMSRPSARRVDRTSPTGRSSIGTATTGSRRARAPPHAPQGLRAQDPPTAEPGESKGRTPGSAGSRGRATASGHLTDRTDRHATIGDACVAGSLLEPCHCPAY